MNEVFKRILDQLTGADFWIALACLALGLVVWLLLGATRKGEQRIVRRQIAGAGLVALFAAGALAVHHLFFIREPIFSNNVTGILILRIAGDDAANSLQADLVEHLDTELQKEAADVAIEVHADTESVNANLGLARAHQEARTIGQRLRAQVVIWGRKIGEKQFFPRITLVSSKDSALANERTNGVQDITDLRLPEELVDEPLYLIHFAVGYSHYARDDFKLALPQFEAALARKGGSPAELADLRFFAANCQQGLCLGQKNMPNGLTKAIDLYQAAADAYLHIDQTRWAMTQANLGKAYADLPTGDLAENLERAIAAYNSALRICTEKDEPEVWAFLQNALGSAYDAMPNGDRAENLREAIAAYTAALRVRTEKDDPRGWAITQDDLGNAYTDLPNGDHTTNLQMAIAAYEAALRVQGEKNFPHDWAATENDLGSAYASFTTGDHAQNLQKAIGAFEAALRVRTEKDFPVDWAMTETNLGNAYDELPTGDHAQNRRKAIEAYQAALHVRTKENFPADWALTQYNLGLLYLEQTSSSTSEDLQKAKECFESALNVWNEESYPEYHDHASSALLHVDDKLSKIQPR